ncbi:MAG: type IV toxin-antitoxin system AbiEi family antitoxin domain-containing protein [Bacillota bacterium]|nr:type IV toxin-antitoxin system AbiEi family antitoxin domain-containing protein [Bacillota bacterium]
MNNKKILEIMHQNNGIISNKDALSYGISRIALHRLKQQGSICSISRGLYSLNDEIPDIMLIIQNRCTKGTFSHETALYFHDLTDRTPIKHVMTVASSYNAKSFKDLPVKFRYVKPFLIELGRKKMKTNQGNEVYVYDLERTICDIIRNKSSMDAGIVNSALRQYARSKKSKYSILMMYAKKLGLENKVRDTMEVLF